MSNSWRWTGVRWCHAAPTPTPPDKGGWNSFCTLWGGLTVSNPGSSYPLRGNGKSGWFGWPTDPEMEAMRQQWFDAPDIPAQQTICEQIQRRRSRPCRSSRSVSGTIRGRSATT